MYSIYLSKRDLSVVCCRMKPGPSLDVKNSTIGKSMYNRLSESVSSFVVNSAMV